MRGWLFRAPEGQRPYLLFFYGSNEDIVVERKRLAYLATALDLNVVAFDYRGYGFSGAQIDPAAMRDDAVSAYDAVSKMALKIRSSSTAGRWARNSRSTSPHSDL